jgi:YVTN family beta-propeller protein
VLRLLEMMMGIGRLLGAVCALAAGVMVACSVQGERELVTGKEMTPAASFAQAVGNFPVNVAVTADGKFAVTTNVGYRQLLHLIRMSDGKSVAQLDYPNRPAAGSRAGEDIENPVVKTNGLYYGLAISADNTLYAAQGGNDSIAVVTIGNGTLKQRGAIKTRSGDFPSGLALDRAGRLYVANQAASPAVTNPFEASGSLAIYDTAKGEEIGRYTFKQSHAGTTNFPLGVAAMPDGSKVYVASERDGAVYVLDTREARSPKLLKTIATGALPTGILLNRDCTALYVANADSDTVSVIDTRTDAVPATINLRPDVARTLPGASPVALALSGDESKLYVALADMNAVAIVDLKAERGGAVKGYVPTGWYPTALARAPGGGSLLVVNAKGTSARLPSGKPRHSPLWLVEGNVQRVKLPASWEFAKSTERVLENNHYERLARPVPEPLAGITRKSGKVTHVVYIIKENRTYDEVLGDLPRGNGEASLCLFGRAVTPNQHALAERFGIFDNLYACGEVSGDGWNWSTQSMANPYVMRNVPYNYSQRGRKFDFEGMNNGYPTAGVPAKGLDGEPAATHPAFAGGAPAVPDVAAAPGGHLWDLCHAFGVSFRNYGCYITGSGSGSSTPGAAFDFPSSSGLLPAGHDLEGQSDFDYRRFDLDYADSDAPAVLAKKHGDNSYLWGKKTFGKYKAASRFAEWNREFQMMLAKDASGGAVPALMMLRVGNDHTTGAKAGKHKPVGYVADNDYAVGQIVEAISHSAIWPHCAIFIIEDDAQSGPDHVDCHRTTGYVISPYRPRGVLDQRFCNTNSFLRTMEILLDLPPMTQYDATATLVQDWAATAVNSEPYQAVMPDEKYFAELNPEKTAKLTGEAARLSKAAEGMDFSNEDSAPALLLNEMIWKSVRGLDSRPPEPRTSRLLPVGKRDADDDD